MIRTLIKYLGLYPYLKIIREKYLPSEGQKQEKSLKPARLLFYRQFIAHGDLCFDVGANIGNRTEIFLALGAKVVAVEPQRDCAAVLKVRFGNRIDLVKGALGANEGEGEIFISDTSEISSLSKEWISDVSKSRFKDKQWGKKETVKVSTLDILIKRYGIPKFCKIDVEGFEEEVLVGLSHPIRLLSFEYTIPERMDSVRNCFFELSKIGMFDCNFTIGENMEFEKQDWISVEEMITILDEMKEKALFGDIYVKFRD
jgi:FkbM family methyltransferase